MITAEQARAKVTNITNKVIEQWLIKADTAITKAADEGKSLIYMNNLVEEQYKFVKSHLEGLGYTVVRASVGCGGTEIKISW